MLGGGESNSIHRFYPKQQKMRIEDFKGGFTIYPTLLESFLPKEEFAVFRKIQNHITDKYSFNMDPENYVQLTISQLVQETGIYRAGVQACLDNLSLAGLINVVASPRKADYAIMWEDIRDLCDRLCELDLDGMKKMFVYLTTDNTNNGMKEEEKEEKLVADDNEITGKIANSKTSGNTKCEKTLSNEIVNYSSNEGVKSGKIDQNSSDIEQLSENEEIKNNEKPRSECMDNNGIIANSKEHLLGFAPKIALDDQNGYENGNQNDYQKQNVALRGMVNHLQEELDQSNRIIKTLSNVIEERQSGNVSFKTVDGRMSVVMAVSESNLEVLRFMSANTNLNIIFKAEDGMLVLNQELKAESGSIVVNQPNGNIQPNGNVAGANTNLNSNLKAEDRSNDVNDFKPEGEEVVNDQVEYLEDEAEGEVEDEFNFYGPESVDEIEEGDEDNQEDLEEYPEGENEERLLLGNWDDDDEENILREAGSGSFNEKGILAKKKRKFPFGIPIKNKKKLESFFKRNSEQEQINRLTDSRQEANLSNLSNLSNQLKDQLNDSNQVNDDSNQVSNDSYQVRNGSNKLNPNYVTLDNPEDEIRERIINANVSSEVESIYQPIKYFLANRRPDKYQTYEAFEFSDILFNKQDHQLPEERFIREIWAQLLEDKEDEEIEKAEAEGRNANFTGKINGTTIDASYFVKEILLRSYYRMKEEDEENFQLPLFNAFSIFAFDLQDNTSDENKIEHYEEGSLEFIIDSTKIRNLGARLEVRKKSKLPSHDRRILDCSTTDVILEVAEEYPYELFDKLSEMEEALLNFYNLMKEDLDQCNTVHKLKINDWIDEARKGLDVSKEDFLKVAKLKEGPYKAYDLRYTFIRYEELVEWNEKNGQGGFVEKLVDKRYRDILEKERLEDEKELEASQN